MPQKNKIKTKPKKLKQNKKVRNGLKLKTTKKKIIKKKVYGFK
jgi:hypothetical protein